MGGAVSASSKHPSHDNSPVLGPYPTERAYLQREQNRTGFDSGSGGSNKDERMHNPPSAVRLHSSGWNGMGQDGTVIATREHCNIGEGDIDPYPYISLPAPGPYLSPNGEWKEANGCDFYDIDRGDGGKGWTDNRGSAATGYCSSRGVYIGERKNNKKDGIGSTAFANGDVHRGTYENDLVHGLGVWTYADGTTFEGNFCNGTHAKRGMYKYPNGDVYEGDVCFHLRHGSGLYISHTGMTFIGQWTMGQLNDMDGGERVHIDKTISDETAVMSLRQFSCIADCDGEGSVPSSEEIDISSSFKTTTDSGRGYCGNSGSVHKHDLGDRCAVYQTHAHKPKQWCPFTPSCSPRPRDEKLLQGFCGVDVEEL
jgi:hypothetical protein